MAEEVVSLREAVQRRLRAELGADAGLKARLETDPGAVIKPIIAELAGDDGDINLSGVETTVHFENDANLHFVITPQADDLAEVSGFASGFLVGDLMGMSVDVGSIGGIESGAKASTGASGDGTTRRCCYGDSPGSTTHKNCSTKAKNCH